MKSGKRTSHTDEVLSALGTTLEAERFASARGILQRHLIHTRDVLNGKDFLFSGPQQELVGALKTLSAVEHRCSRFLQVDFVQIEDYFLLRVVGSAGCKEIIQSYFD